MIGPGRRALLLAVVTVAGAAVLAVEMAAPRLLAPYFGTSHPVWTNVIGVVLGALALGYALGGRLASRSPTFRTAGFLLLAGATATALAARFGTDVARSVLPDGVDLEGVQSVLVRGSLYATLVLFGPPLVLTGMLTPVVVEILARDRHAGNAAGAVLGFSTAGSIAGTFLATHVLIPLWGTRATMHGSAAAIAACGLALLVAGGGAGGRGAVAGVGAALVAVAVAPAGATPLLRPTGPESGVTVLLEFESAYQFGQVRQVALDGGGSERLLTLNEGVNTYHSVRREGSALTGGRYYDLYPALPLLAGVGPGDPLRVLILGSAAGTQAMALHHFHGGGGLHVDAVEIDGAVVEAGHAHFGLPRAAPWLRQHVMDARAFLRAADAAPPWDLVLIDCYANEYYLPFHLATEEFFALVRARLRPGGLVAYNAYAYRADDPLLRALAGATAAAFGRAWRIPVEGYPNFVVVARNADGWIPWEGFAARARAGGFPEFTARPEGEEALDLAVRAFRRAFPVEAGGAGTLRLTDDRAPVERLADLAVAAEEAALVGGSR